MDRYDRLPPELRSWLAAAALPWSPRSVLRLWNRLLREARGDVAAVLARLDRAEQKMLARDCPRIWGDSYPMEVVQARGRIVTAHRGTTGMQ